MPKITAGQEFDSLADFKTYLRAWAVEDSFTPAILDSDARRVRVGCRTAPNCPFRIRCNFDQSTNKARVSTLVAKHTCQEARDPDATVIRGEVTKLRFLLDAVPNLLMVDHNTHTKEIIGAVKDRYGTTISLRQAQKVKATLLQLASEALGNDLYKRLREKLGDDATEEEMRRGKRLRPDEAATDPVLKEEPAWDGYDEDDYQDEGMDYDDLEEDEYLYEHPLPEPSQDLRFEDTADHAAGLNQGGDVLNLDLTGQTTVFNQRPTAAELRAQAASLFQQASKKFQEATQLHMQASKLFTQATELDDGLVEQP